MKNLFKENKPLFFVSIIGVVVIISGIYYGSKLESYRDIKIENEKLKAKNNFYQNQIDSLSGEIFTSTIDKERYEFILDQFEQVKEDSLILDCISRNTE